MHVFFCNDNSSDRESTLLDNIPSISSHNDAWKEFGHLKVNSLLLKIEELRTLAFNTNISVLGVTERKLHNTVSNEALQINGYRNKKMVVELLSTSKIIFLIIDNQVFLKTLKRLF